MAFFDKLKDVAGKAKEAAVKAAAAASEFAEQAKEKEAQRRQAAEEAEAARKAEEEQRRAERLNAISTYKEGILSAFMDSDWNTYDELMEKYKSIANQEEDDELEISLNVAQYEKCNAIINKLAEKPSCELGQGDCCWLGLNFYCTCSDVDCPKKKYISSAEHSKPFSPEHLPYIRFLSRFYTEGNLKFVDDETRIEFFNAIRIFFIHFLPEHAPSLIGEGSNEIIAFTLARGFGASNLVMDILFSIHEQTDGKIVPPIDLLIEKYKSDEDALTKPYYKNPSLYDRSRADMEYTLTALEIIGDPSVWEEASINAEEASLDKLFNEDGTIKEAGIGGPRNGFYGDVIFNLVNSWIMEEE